MCKLLEVSETGYYRYVRRLGRPDKDTILSAEIEKILRQSENLTTITELSAYSLR